VPAANKVKILLTEFVTHDVKRFIIEKPAGLKFIPGQAVDLSIAEGEWESMLRPFTFTSRAEDLVLEFTIKRYDEHDGVTKHLHSLAPGKEVILHEVFGTINYKGNGTFIAAGAGITPFIAILRDLRQKNELEGNKLIFSNKTINDVILRQELEHMFGYDPEKLQLVLTREEAKGFHFGRIDADYIGKKISDFKQHFYLCGPKPFVAAIKEILVKKGADAETVVVES
jgi:ferredoxin-NADP reductase